MSTAERAQVELEYHQMNPADFDEMMLHATVHIPATLHLPDQLVEGLEALAEVTGEPNYQTMVSRWIEERLQQETSFVLRLTKQLKRKRPKTTQGSK